MDAIKDETYRILGPTVTWAMDGKVQRIRIFVPCVKRIAAILGGLKISRYAAMVPGFLRSNSDIIFAVIRSNF